jgi:hypothetical protein
MKYYLMIIHLNRNLSYFLKTIPIYIYIYIYILHTNTLDWINGIFPANYYLFMTTV